MYLCYFIVCIYEYILCFSTVQYLGSSGVRLTEKHVPTLLDQLKSEARVWRRIGMHLGFTQRELDNIQTRPSLLFEAPCSWLVSMLEEWIQSAQGDKYGSTNFATLEHLKAALHDAGLEVLAYKVNVVVPGNTSDMARESAVIAMFDTPKGLCIDSINMLPV